MSDRLGEIAVGAKLLAKADEDEGLNEPVKSLFHRLAFLGRENPVRASVSVSLLHARDLEKDLLGAVFLEDYEGFRFRLGLGAAGFSARLPTDRVDRLALRATASARLTSQARSPAFQPVSLGSSAISSRRM